MSTYIRIIFKFIYVRRAILQENNTLIQIKIYPVFYFIIIYMPYY